MKLFKAKAPFFSGSYYKELFRELMRGGIIFSVLQLFYGIMGEFGSGNGYSFSLLSMIQGVRTARSHPDAFPLFFLACGIHFLSTHVWRKNWDFRNSLPIAKRTMFSCHFAAVLTWAVIIFIANYVGVFIGEGLRLIVKDGTVPDGFGMSAVTMLRSILSGVTLYCLIVILGSIVNRVIPTLAAIGVAAGLPILFVGFESYIRYNGMDTLELFFPLGIDGLATFKTVVSILWAILLAVLAYIAFGKSRVETYQKPSRTAWINVLIGLGVAACVGIVATIIIMGTSNFMNYKQGGSYYSMPSWYICIAYACIPMLIAYFIYMWITERSFVSALKKLLFLPLALIVFGSAILIAVIADNKWAKLNFAADNIEYVRLKDRFFSGGGNYYDYHYYSTAPTKRGSSDAFSVKHTDETLLREFASIARNSIHKSDSVLESLFSVDQGDTVEITLKDGTKWGLSSSLNSMSVTCRGMLEEDAAYIDKLGSLDRFKGGKVLNTVDFGAEFNKTLYDELSALTSLERAKILTKDSSSYYFLDYYGYTYYSLDQSEWKSEYDCDIVFASPTYDHVAIIPLGEKFPRTTELYMKLMSERTRAHKDFDEFVSDIKSGDFYDFEAAFSIFENGKMLKRTFVFEGNGYQGTDNTEYKAEVRRILDSLAECIEANEPIEGAPAVIGLDILRFWPMNESNNSSFYGFTSLFEGVQRLYVGVSSEKAEELMQMLNDFSEKHFQATEDDGYYYTEEMTAVAKAVDDGTLKLYSEDGVELSAEEIEKLYYSGCEWFVVEGGYQVHITDIYAKLIETLNEMP
ncbi:MAG: YIP1 family protein [Clostridia bacterium]|nr:YIP1 family protein [Clostridia bacterium]